MALSRHVISWPLTGGLDTKKSPLSVQPGSFLRLDNVVQERQGEWRRRNGWTQASADTMPDAAAFAVGGIGSAFFLNGQTSPYLYVPGIPAWKGTFGSPQPPQHRSRQAFINASTPICGFAMLGNLQMVAATSDFGGGTTTTSVYMRDATSGIYATPVLQNVFSGQPVRCCATAASLIAVYIDTGGNLKAIVVAPSGTITGATTIQTGMPTSGAMLDVRWYGGSTITIVAMTTGNTIRFIEFNPATAVTATNVVLAAVSCNAGLGLLQDPDATGTRFVVTSFSTPTTRVLRVNSAGTILTNDQVEAVASTQIAGVATESGASWNVIYRTGTNLRVNGKTAGVVQSPADFQSSTNWSKGYLQSQAWRRAGDASWSVIVGVDGGISDPQPTFVEFYLPTSAAGGSATAVSVIETEAAGYSSTIAEKLAQVVQVSANRFMYALPVQIIYEDNAGAVVQHYSIDVFDQRYLSSADDASVNTGPPVKWRGVALIPGGQLCYFDGIALRRLGTRTPPRVLSVVTSNSTGALTPSSQYEYTAVVEQIGPDGDIWRSPPSVPILVTLGPSDNTATVTVDSWAVEETIFGLVGAFAKIRISLYRSAADGSSPRRWYSQLFTPGTPFNVIDTFSDTVVNQGEVLYTEGEAPTGITPPASWIWLADDRLWAMNREYPTEFGYTKNLRPGRLPEFVDENVIDLDDAFGDGTGGGLLDDKIVVFKKNAVYFLQGSGFTDSGSGENYVPTLISSDVGALPGSPIVSSADALYFVSERGIMRLDKQGNISWVGEPVDQYLHQPLVQTPETVYDGCFVPSANEVRFLTTDYVLVHNLTFDYWVRWTLSGFRRCLVVNGQMVMFRNDGTVWREGDQTQLTDQGVAFTGVIRSPWMRPAPGISGYPPTNTSTTGQRAMRLYEGRIIYTRTSGGSDVNLTGRIYANNDDAQVQEFTGQAIDGATLAGAASMKPLAAIQKCTSFSEELVLPSGDVTVRVDGFAAVIGLRDGAQAVDPGSRYK